MNKDTFLHNCYVIDELMRMRGIETYADLARIADINYRTLMRLRNGTSFASKETSTKLVDALGQTSLEEIGARTRAEVLGSRSDAIGPSIPKGIAFRDELLDALNCDLRGNPIAAVHVARDVLAKLEPDDLRSFLVATAKLTSFLCNCGRHAEAWKVCKEALARAERAGRKVRGSDEAHWIAYHGAIALRRDGKLRRAEEVFDKLKRLRTHRVGALHQLAVIEILRARAAADPKDRGERLDKAEALLRQCLKAWKGDHREAFSLRRAAEVDFLRGRICSARKDDAAAERHDHLAFSRLTRALIVFSDRHLTRYVEATMASVLTLYVIKGKNVEKIPTIVPDPRVSETEAVSRDGRGTVAVPRAVHVASSQPGSNGHRRSGTRKPAATGKPTTRRGKAPARRRQAPSERAAGGTTA